MRVTSQLVSALLLIAAGTAHAASSWSFDDGRISIVSKKDAEGSAEKLSPKSALPRPVTLGHADTAKISLTTKDNGKGKRPHQAFIILKEEDSGLEAPFPLNVREDGKASVQIAQKDLPTQLLLSKKPLHASVVLASFGSSQGSLSDVFDLNISLDPNTPAPTYEKPLRYGKLEEIHHIFRDDPRSPPVVISLFFSLAVLATLPVLLVSWLMLGANLNSLSSALSRAPISHAVFFGSIIGMEAVFAMYYTSWNLFQTLPAMAVVGAVMLLSGSKALGEVQSRRLAGER